MKDLLRRTLEPDPTKRITSAELWSVIDSLRGGGGRPTNLESNREELKNPNDQSNQASVM